MSITELEEARAAAAESGEFSDEDAGRSLAERSAEEPSDSFFVHSFSFSLILASRASF